MPSTAPRSLSGRGALSRYDRKMPSRPTSELVAIVLAVGISVALNVVTVALLWAAYVRLGVDPDSGLSENGTQLLTGWGGGIIGVLGAFVGYSFGKRRDKPDD